MDAISSGDEYDAEAISMDMLEDICEGIKSHPIINRRECEEFHFLSTVIYVHILHVKVRMFMYYTYCTYSFL